MPRFHGTKGPMYLGNLSNSMIRERQQKVDDLLVLLVGSMKL